MRTNLARLRSILFVSTLSAALAACSSGSSTPSPPPPPANSPPIVNAGANQTVLENTVVTLTGTATDANAGDTLTYSWTQTGGAPAVTINNATMAVADFMAPDVALGAPAVLTFQLSVSDGTATRTDTVDITVQEPQPVVNLSGTVMYEFVPPNYTGPPNHCTGLDYGSIVSRPVRGATIELIDATGGGVLQTSTLSDTGTYAFANVDANSDVRLRIRAELKRQGAPSWDVEIRDNFINGASDSDVPPPPPLGTRALYVLDGADFNTGGIDLVRDLTATTGWGGANYTGPRAAAPFAILDAIYSGMQLVLEGDANAAFAPMDAFWSVNNTRINSGPTDYAAGELHSTHYHSGLDSLFMMGDASTNTDEFDVHVTLHEWGHYFEDTFSRSDSIGGGHFIGEPLDLRLAFGEGWASALAGMALDDPIYCDSRGNLSLAGFGIDVEDDNDISSAPGWYNEFSIITFIYDLYDVTNEGTDTGSIGFGPIYDTMVGPQATSEAWTSVFSFAAELRPMLNAAGQALLDSQLNDIDVVNGVALDVWGTNETNDRNGARDALPVYTAITADGSTTNLCTNSDFDVDGFGDPIRDGNKLGEYRYIRLNIPATDTYDVSIVTTTATPVTPDPNDRDQSDPDMWIYREGQSVLPFPTGLSPVENSETFTTPTLIAGEVYVADLHEWRFEDVDGAPDTYPDQVCFDVTFTQTP